MPFKVLKSEEAQSRISVVRNMTAFEKADLISGVPRYSHPGRAVKGHVSVCCHVGVNRNDTRAQVISVARSCFEDALPLT